MNWKEYKIEGSGEHKTVFASTGRAILLTSLTTMLGFGSLWFATMRSLGSMGIALFVGGGTCFIATVLVIPVISGMAGRLKNSEEYSVQLYLRNCHCERNGTISGVPLGKELVSLLW